MPEFQTTEYFLYMRSRPDRKIIRDEWIIHVVQNPEREEIQSDGRFRRWARIADYNGRALRVVLLQDGVTVHNAFFDRGFEQGDKA